MIQCQHLLVGCCKQCSNPRDKKHPHGYMRTPLKDNVSSIVLGPFAEIDVVVRRLLFNLTTHGVAQ